MGGSILLLAGQAGETQTAFPAAGMQAASDRVVTAPAPIVPETTFVEIAKNAAPAVVHLKTIRKTPAGWLSFRWDSGRGLLEPFFQDWWRRFNQPAVKQQGVGSGFLIHPSGFVLTNHHVVDHADSIRAVLSDGQEVPASVVGRNPRLDLALVRLEGPGPFPLIPMGDSDRLEAGEWAIAVGSPFGLSQTFTVGVISATRRSHLGFGSDGKFIQTDASINYGNSGGPLLNIESEAIGINTAMIPSAHGIGFAIPINTARKFAESLLKKQWIMTPWVGLRISLHPSASAEAGRGIAVAGVQWRSPADRAGLRPSDRIIRIDEETVIEVDQLRRIIAAGGVENRRIFTIERKGEALEIAVQPEGRRVRLFP